MSASENAKQSYISHGAKVQWVTRKNQLGQRSDVANFKASLVFLTFHFLLTFWVHSDSHPLSQWCHPAISSFVVPFSSCLRSFLASRSCPVSLHIRWPKYWNFSFTSVLPMNIQDWFLLGFDLSKAINLLNLKENKRSNLLFKKSSLVNKVALDIYSLSENEGGRWFRENSQVASLFGDGRETVDWYCARGVGQRE